MKTSTGTTTITDSDLLHTISGTMDLETGANDEALQLRDTIKALAAEKETFSSNVDNFLIVQGRSQDDNRILTGLMADLNGQVEVFTNELSQEKS